MERMVILGIDYGSKRWGLAYADEIGIALPMDPIVVGNVSKRWEALAYVIGVRKITHLVVGYPVDPQGNSGAQARIVDSFISDLQERFGLPVVRQDERYTSQMAAEAIKASKLGKKNKGLQRKKQIRLRCNIDSRAAAIILQDYLEAIS